MKHIIRIAISLGISFAILAILVKMVSVGVSDEVRPSIFATLQNTSLTLVFAYLVTYLIGIVVRAYRYRLLIMLSGETNLPNFKQMFLVTGIRNMMVDMLPARLGELGYVGFLNRGYGVKLKHCLSSLTTAIAFDFVALVVIVLMLLVKQSVSADVQVWAIAAAAIAFIIAIIALLGLFLITPAVSSWANGYFTNLKQGSLIAKALHLLSDFSESLLTIRSAGRTLHLIVVSVFIRLFKYLGLYCLFQAVIGASFPSLLALPSEQIVSALIGGEIAASLPIPTFMSFGAYEAGGALVFQFLGVSDKVAGLVTLLSVHIWSQFMEYLIGGVLVAIFVLVHKNKSVSIEGQPASRTRAFIITGLSGAVLVIGLFFLAWQLRAANKVGALSLSAPDAGTSVKEKSGSEHLSQLNSLNGFVVWSSNRDGNHDIFKMDLPDMAISKIVESEYTETYPRVSPDGTKLVFSRSKQPWVPQRNTIAWDVYLLDLDTNTQTKLAENSTMPRWLDNEQVTVLSNGHIVRMINVNDLSSENVYETGVGNKMPLNALISNPSYNPQTKQVTFTARQNDIGSKTGFWGTAISQNGEHQGIHNGCELTWSSNNQNLYQVTPGGNQGVKIIEVDPVTYQATPLIDLSGEFSHEYWPKDANTGDYIVFGASRGQKDHEHDTKDYELFLWKKGSDSSQATRLTFHTGNDNWPDIYLR